VSLVANREGESLGRVGAINFDSLHNTPELFRLWCRVPFRLTRRLPTTRPLNLNSNVFFLFDFVRTS